jgi:hypothetical protein
VSVRKVTLEVPEGYLNIVEKLLADYQPPIDPFNGATTLVLAPGVMTAMSEAIEAWARNPMMGKCPEIEVRPTLPDGHGYGFRDWRDGDDPEFKELGTTVVWILAPKTK